HGIEAFRVYEDTREQRLLTEAAQRMTQMLATLWAKRGSAAPAGAEAAAPEEDGEAGGGGVGAAPPGAGARPGGAQSVLPQPRSPPDPGGGRFRRWNHLEGSAGPWRGERPQGSRRGGRVGLARSTAAAVARP